jgi:hypothetical protein
MTMSRVAELAASPLTVANVGLPSFAEELRSQGVDVRTVEWAPPLGGDTRLGWALARMLDGEHADGRDDRIREANETAIERLLGGQPVWVDVAPAREALTGLTDRTILHSGPPVEWRDMAGPMRGAVIGALLYEGLAESPEGAERLCDRGEIRFASCHDFGAVGPMAGIISPSMPVLVVENAAHGNRAFSNLNEGLGKALRFGAYNREVLQRLAWMRDVLAPTLATAVRSLGGVDLKTITAQALQMGDECHNRNAAATSLLFRRIAPVLVANDLPRDHVRQVLEFVAGNDHFFLNFSMAACKATLDAATSLPGSTLVTAMSRNGVEFGIRVSGTDDRWYTAPAERIDGLLFPGFSAEDAALDIGDSAITETCGIGGFAMAAAPAIVQFVGGSPATAVNYTREMLDITLARNPAYVIPSLSFGGTPTGIDVRLVADTGTLPVINTGIAHKDAGVGQIGAGIVRPPMECFTQAIEALAKEVGVL